MPLFSVRALAALALTVAAPVVEAAESSPPEDLAEILEQMPGSDQITEITYFDMSSNGRSEALVYLGGLCDQGACEWKLFAEGESGWRAVGGGAAQSVAFEPTMDSGAVVNADGITWAYSGGPSMYMWGDLLEGLRPEAASDEEYRLVGGTSQYKETSRLRLEKFELDLNGDSHPERIFLIGGLHYKVGMWGTPYLIYDQNDDLILSGVSTDTPRIFRSAHGSSVVVNVVPAGLQVAEIK